MQAETRTMTQLFQLDVRYLIPLYQRPYVWTEEQQWAPLWEDIVTVAEHFLAEGTSSKPPTHFLGAIVIQQQDNPPGTPQRFLVIDGQQRLTTLQLLVGAAARVAEKLGCAAEAELLGRLIYNNALLAKDDERFKVWPTNANQHAFRLVMDPDGVPVAVQDDPTNEIQEGHAFFAREIDAWVTDDGTGQVASHFAALRVALSELLKLVSIRLEDGDNPQVIFETLNARGTPLIALDLLKNTVFLVADSEDADTEKLYYQHWAPELDLEYWRANRRQGRLFTKNGDLFLQYWLIAEMAEPVPATELFGTFRDGVLQPASCPPMTELIPRLVRDARTLRELDAAPPESPQGRFYRLVELLDTTTVMPLALILLRSPELSAERRANALSVLESFLVRRMLCGGTSKNYNRLAASLVGAINKDLGHADEVLAQRLAAETAPANVWPTDDAVRDAVETKPLYGNRRQDRLVMVLWEIEQRLRRQDSKAEQGLQKPPKLTLEHLIPQSWAEHWPLGEHRDDAEEWRNAHVHRLGNLTLTTGQLNSSVSNGPWYAPELKQDKSRALPKHSLLKLNTIVAHDYPQHFDEATVDERGAQFSMAICEIWPGPAAAPAPHATALAEAPAASETPEEEADDDRPRRRRYYAETIADLVAAGLLADGAVLRPMSARYDGEAIVRADGTLRVSDEVVNAPTTAAQRVTGRHEPGWEFWGVPDTAGGAVSLAALRERLSALGGASGLPGGRRRGPGRAVYDVTLGDLVDGGFVSDGETVIALRKKVGQVEATIHADGEVRVDGNSYASLSAAASAVSGSSQPGWEYWAVRREERLVSLYEIRRRYLAERGY